MYAMNNNNVIVEHKRNVNIYYGVLDIIINKDTHGMKNIKYHMKQLNKYNKHIRYELFINLSVIRCYGLNNIQLKVLYNNLLFNGHIK
jgi:hypothetical protein